MTTAVDANTVAYLPLTTDLTDQCGNAWVANGGAAVSGGALVLDGTGYLSSAGVASVFSGQFTAEMYLNLADATAQNIGVLFAQNVDYGLQWGFLSDTSAGVARKTIDWLASGWQVPALNTELHLALSRDASNVIRYFIGGSLIASFTSAWAFTDGVWVLGGFPEGYRIAGKVKHFRISKTARYTASFTPPTFGDNSLARRRQVV